MSRKTFWITLSILIVVIGVLLYMDFGIEKEPKCDAVYPMANQHITWEGAGYNGIYGRNQE